MTQNAYLPWAFRRVAGSFRRLGLRETSRLIGKNVVECARQYLNLRYDRKHHVETSGIVQLSDLTCESANKTHGVWYQPTPLRTLKGIFTSLPEDVSDYTFVDFGSGKARTLLFASSY